MREIDSLEATGIENGFARMDAFTEKDTSFNEEELIDEDQDDIDAEDENSNHIRHSGSDDLDEESIDTTSDEDELWDAEEDDGEDPDWD